MLATAATVASGAYERAVLAADPLVRLTSVACPQLAQISQTGAPITEEDVELARELLRAAARGAGRHRDPRLHALPVRRARCCSACSARRSRSSPPAPRSRAASSTRSRCATSRTPRTGEGRYSFLCTGDAAAFAEVGSRFLQLPMGAVDHVELATEALA